MHRLSIITVLCFAAFTDAPSLRAQDMTLSQILIDGEGWQQLGEGYKFTEGPAPDAHGNMYFTDVGDNKIYKIDPAGKIILFAKDTAQTDGLMVGPDGRLYGCRITDQKITAYDPDGTMHIIAEGVANNDLVINSKGDIYVSDPPNHQVWLINTRGEKRVVAKGLDPNGIILWADQQTLVVTEATSPHLWAFRVEADGSLNFRDKYYGPLRLRPDTPTPGSDGMTIDKDGRLYVTTYAGLQVFDPTGRLAGVILKPQEKFLSNVKFGGPDFSYLYITCEDKVYRRKTKTAGVPYNLGKAK